MIAYSKYIPWITNIINIISYNIFIILIWTRSYFLRSWFIFILLRSWFIRRWICIARNCCIANFRRYSRTTLTIHFFLFIRMIRSCWIISSNSWRSRLYTTCCLLIESNNKLYICSLKEFLSMCTNLYNTTSWNLHNISLFNLTSEAIAFQSLPYFFKPFKNNWCSFSLHRPMNQNRKMIITNVFFCWWRQFGNLKIIKTHNGMIPD